MREERAQRRSLDGRELLATAGEGEERGAPIERERERVRDHEAGGARVRMDEDLHELAILGRDGGVLGEERGASTDHLAEDEAVLATRAEVKPLRAEMTRDDGETELETVAGTGERVELTDHDVDGVLLGRETSCCHHQPQYIAAAR